MGKFFTPALTEPGVGGNNGACNPSVTFFFFFFQSLVKCMTVCSVAERPLKEKNKH